MNTKDFRNFTEELTCNIKNIVGHYCGTAENRWAVEGLIEQLQSNSKRKITDVECLLIGKAFAKGLEEGQKLFDKIH